MDCLCYKVTGLLNLDIVHQHVYALNHELVGRYDLLLIVVSIMSVFWPLSIMLSVICFTVIIYLAVINVTSLHMFLAYVILCLVFHDST